MNPEREGGGYLYPSKNTRTLEQLGVALSRDGDKLRVKAPPGVITPELRVWLAKNKESLLVTLDWQEFYGERAAVAEHCGKMPRDQSEKQAFESCVSKWLDKHLPVIILDVCTHCGKRAGVIGRDAIITGSGHWLHHKCHSLWQVHRRQQAIDALATIGITE